jgi:hypothetical protein
VKKKFMLFFLLVGFLRFTAPSTTSAYTFGATSGDLSATADFEASGTKLIVTLTNNSTYDALVPTDILTAVFFTIEGIGSLTPESAVLANGSTVFFGSDGFGNVGGEWAYASGLSGAPGGATQGISSSGLGLFGSGNFEGSDLQGPPSGAVDGLQYGITSAGDNPATGNTPVTGTNALIKNAVVFTLSGLPADFEYSKISNVSFQYGTSLSEPNVPVPEPATMVLLGSGLIGLAVFGRRRFFQ